MGLLWKYAEYQSSGLMVYSLFVSPPPFLCFLQHSSVCLKKKVRSWHFQMSYSMAYFQKSQQRWIQMNSTECSTKFACIRRNVSVSHTVCMCIFRAYQKEKLYLIWSSKNTLTYNKICNKTLAICHTVQKMSPHLFTGLFHTHSTQSLRS